MLINRHNLEIFAHCAKEPDSKGRQINNLQITGNGTVVTNGYYSVAVSAVESNPLDTPVHISPESARVLLEALGDREGSFELGIAEMRLQIGKTTHRADLVEAKFPLIEGYKAADTPIFETVISVDYLLAIAQALASFRGELARISLFGPAEPVRIDSRNLATGQKLEAFIMPRKPGYDKHRFEPPATPEPQAAAPVEDDFSKAMAEAAKLMGS